MDNKIILSKPYSFEGENHCEIDLQGLDDLKAKDLVNIDRIFALRGNSLAMKEFTLDYAIVIANRVTGKPIEFFEDLPIKDAVELKNTVVRFFYGED